MSVVHLKKRDIVKSKVRGVDMEFDHEKSATILACSAKMEYVKLSRKFPVFGKRDTSSFLDLSYMDHLMSRRLVNLPRVMIRHMSYVISMKDHESPYEIGSLWFFKHSENVIWWIGSGENRRRDDDVDAQEVEAEEEEERNQDGFDWEAVIDEAAVEGESGSGEKFYDAENKDQDSPEVQEETPTAAPQSSAQQKEQGTSGVDRSSPTAQLPKSR
ncbi:hypothetical protein Dimus_015658 [Dionaea muscipula]